MGRTAASYQADGRVTPSSDRGGEPAQTKSKEPLTKRNLWLRFSDVVCNHELSWTASPGVRRHGRCMRFTRRLAMTEHRVVGHDAWVDERRKHLVKEKEFTRLRDQLSRERRELPWELVEKDYKFEGERGVQTLSEMFDGRSQLVVYHAMFNPETAGPNTTWTVDAGCPYCSFWMDNFNGITVHLNHRDITMVAVSRAPYPAIAA